LFGHHKQRIPPLRFGLLSSEPLNVHTNRKTKEKHVPPQNKIQNKIVISLYFFLTKMCIKAEN
jgi:hypothetical protein